MGTPAPAVPTLAALTSQHDVGLVITQPDRPKGRSKRPAASEVKEYATSAGLTILQPDSPEDLKEAVESQGMFDAGVVVAYGRLLSPGILNLPRMGMLNVHFSLLPRWRGAAPVSRALMAGDTMTGVTIIEMDEGLDTGAVLTAQALDIANDVDAGALTSHLADMGASLMLGSLPSFLNDSVRPVAQSDEGATYASKITAQDRPLNINVQADAFVNQVRGLSPSPGATIEIDGQQHKVLKAKVSAYRAHSGSWDLIEGSVVIGVRDGSVEIVTLQPSGRNTQSGPDWARGRRATSGRVG